MANPIANEHVSHERAPAGRWTLDPALPLISLVVAATAVPIDLRFGTLAIDWRTERLDVIANLLAYVPVGMVLARLGFGRAIALATLIAVLAEGAQVFAMFRFVSPLDAVWNSAGAAIGALISSHWGVRVPSLPVTARTGAAAAFAAFAIVALDVAIAWATIEGRRASEDLTVNTRGADTPGSLEAHWRFDDSGDVVAESSGQAELAGNVVGDATRVPGVFGTAIRLGGDDYVDLGTPPALRLMGSVTVTAWINAADFPVDDAAIVSAFVPGYQLDITKDKGPRTLGFKLIDPCGGSMSRYGRTELERDKWYFVAGVYDAAARAMHVYLDGELDDGPLSGTVVARQEPPGEPVFIGRRPEPDGWGFIGSIDDVRIYSEALSAERIAALLTASEVATDAQQVEPLRARRGDVMSWYAGPSIAGCRATTAPRDSAQPLLLVTAGLLTAIAAAALGLTAARVVVVGGLVAVALLLPATAVFLPTRVLWLVPTLVMSGAAAVGRSLRPRAFRASRGS